MIVVDASVVVEMLIETPVGIELERRLWVPAVNLFGPALLDVEVAQVIRRYCRSGELTEQEGSEAIRDLEGLPITRYRHEGLLPGIWQLRHEMTAYDAAYVVLAEHLNATLLTRDRKMATSAAARIQVELV